MGVLGAFQVDAFQNDAFQVNDYWGFESGERRRSPPARVDFPDLVLPSLPSAALVPFGFEAPAIPPRVKVRSPDVVGVVLPAPPAAAWGWQTIPSGPRISVAAPVPLEVVLPPLAAGTWGWEISAAPRHPRPAIVSDVGLALPALVFGAWGWEAPALLPRPAPAASPDVDLALPPLYLGAWGWESSPAGILARLAAPRAPDLALPPLAAGPWGWQIPPAARRPSTAAPAAQDLLVLPAPIPVLLVPAWGFEASPTRRWIPAREAIHADDWWPGAEAQRLPSRGGGDWYEREDLYEDEELAEALRDLICDIDKELLQLSAENRREICEPDVAVPDAVYPPGWRAGREEERERQEDPSVRHVHYDFAADVDFGFRRKIVSFLQSAERVGVDILGSDARLAPRDLVLPDHVIRRGTNVWHLELAPEARLGVARFCARRGFKLVSFDATSLLWIHRKTFPWRPVLLGAGAGLLAGHILWNRPRQEEPVARGKKKK